MSYIRMYILHQYLYCDCLFLLFFFTSAFESVAKFQVRQDVECRSRESLQPSQEVGDLPSWRDGIDTQVIYSSLIPLNEICHGIPSTKGCLNKFGNITKYPFNSIYCMVFLKLFHLYVSSFRFDFNFSKAWTTTVGNLGCRESLCRDPGIDTWHRCGGRVVK